MCISGIDLCVSDSSPNNEFVVLLFVRHFANSNKIWIQRFLYPISPQYHVNLTQSHPNLICIISPNLTSISPQPHINLNSISPQSHLNLISISPRARSLWTFAIMACCILSFTKCTPTLCTTNYVNPDTESGYRIVKSLRNTRCYKYCKALRAEVRAHSLYVTVAVGSPMHPEYGIPTGILNHKAMQIRPDTPMTARFPQVTSYLQCV